MARLRPLRYALQIVQWQMYTPEMSHGILKRNSEEIFEQILWKYSRINFKIKSKIIEKQKWIHERVHVFFFRSFSNSSSKT